MSWSSHSNTQSSSDSTEEYAPSSRDDLPPQDNPNLLWNMRDRLFLSLFERISSAYSSAVPADCRKSVEIMLLAFAILPLFILIYIHVNFIQTPVNCLAHISNDWPRDGILRVELEFKDLQPYLEDPKWKCHQKASLTNNNGISDVFSERNFSKLPNNENEILYHFSSSGATLLPFQEIPDYAVNTTWNPSTPIPKSSLLENHISEADIPATWPQQKYIIEYTLEYGYLKLSEATRQKLGISVLVVVLDPYDEKCFGNPFSQFLLKYVVGYSDVLMSSLKNLVDKDETKGFVRNVISGDQYRFVNKTLTWTSYVVAGLTMIAFTLSISMLLRYSHCQIFLFIVQLLHVMEFNLNTSFPAASILTVVFALVGMEAIMSEFFNDSTTALYIILIVWVSDQFDTVCCRHIVTRRHWLRFFYLYHFAFYAYDYRFNGQYSALALFTSWMFIQHSMIYFFHRFELPTFEPSEADNQINQNDPSPPLFESSSISSSNDNETSFVDDQNQARYEPNTSSEFSDVDAAIARDVNYIQASENSLAMDSTEVSPPKDISMNVVYNVQSSESSSAMENCSEGSLPKVQLRI